MRERLLIAVVAGEASGDLLGAHLIKALKDHLPDAKFIGIGGPKMEAEGFQSRFPMEKLAVRGYIEVLRHYFEITGIRRKLARQLLDEKPDLFIGIDAPDFNLSLERRLKRAGIRTAHYVSPSIWAWRGSRIKHIAKAVSHMLVLFPFEADLYRNAGVSVTYVGHPLADIIPEHDQTDEMRALLKVPAGSKIVTLMPGSRQSELAYLGHLFAQTAKEVAKTVPNVHFLVPLLSRETRAQFDQALYDAGATEIPITVLFGHGRDALAASDVALIASGTATLEAALLRKPMVIAYRMNGLTWKLMSKLRYQPWVGLPNILSGEFVVPELLQDEATPHNLSQALANLLRDPVVMARLPDKLAHLHHSLRMNTAQRAAEAIRQLLGARAAA
jgi:lipid-A-disaccharide synthase